MEQLYHGLQTTVNALSASWKSSLNTNHPPYTLAIAFLTRAQMKSPQSSYTSLWNTHTNLSAFPAAHSDSQSSPAPTPPHCAAAIDGQNSRGFLLQGFQYHHFSHSIYRSITSLLLPCMMHQGLALPKVSAPDKPLCQCPHVKWQYQKTLTFLCYSAVD